ncbi:MAG: F0F1 ATP synthase subunit delta [Thiotrichaceae bacterium]|nr:F0F1 ATP synthase subunit delta [Thiotrichaceae bacterium]
MSELITTARPYARAVFELASEGEALAQWSETLTFLGAIVSDDSVHAVLDNPSLTKQEVAQIVIELADGQLDSKAENLVKQLAEYGRLEALPEIVALFEVMKDEAEGVVEVTITSAQELKDEEIQSISAALKKRLDAEIKVKTTIDKSILGGVIIRAGDLVIDGSIQGRMHNITQALVG